MHTFFFIFLAAIAAGLPDSLDAAMSHDYREESTIDRNRFYRPDIYGCTERTGRSALIRRGDLAMAALLDSHDIAERMRALAELRKRDEYGALCLAIRSATSISDVRKVIKVSPFWPLIIFDKELFAQTCLVINRDLLNTLPEHRRKKLNALHSLVARWWMPDHVMRFFETMSDAYLAHDGYASHGSSWPSEYVSFTNISPFSSIEPARYSRTIIPKETIKRAWYGQADQQNVAEKSFVVCIDDSFEAEQQCNDHAVLEQEEVSAAVVEASMSEYQSKSSLVVQPVAAAQLVRRLQLPGENAAPSRFSLSSFDINALARTLAAITTSSSLSLWENGAAVEPQAAAAPVSQGRELMIVPQKNRVQGAQPMVLAENMIVQIPLQEKNISQLWNKPFDIQGMAVWLSRAARHWMPSHPSNAGALYALEAPQGVRCVARPLWRRCLSTLGVSLYRKRYHFAIAGAVIGVAGAAYLASRTAFGAHGAALPLPADTSPFEMAHNPHFKLTI